MSCSHRFRQHQQSSSSPAAMVRHSGCHRSCHAHIPRPIRASCSHHHSGFHSWSHHRNSVADACPSQTLPQRAVLFPSSSAYDSRHVRIRHGASPDKLSAAARGPHHSPSLSRPLDLQRHHDTAHHPDARGRCHGAEDLAAVAIISSLGRITISSESGEGVIFCSA